jgi:hypothetical protein
MGNVNWVALNWTLATFVGIGVHCYLLVQAWLDYRAMGQSEKTGHAPSWRARSAWWYAVAQTLLFSFVPFKALIGILAAAAPAAGNTELDLLTLFYQSTLIGGEWSTALAGVSFLMARRILTTSV